MTNYSIAVSSSACVGKVGNTALSGGGSEASFSVWVKPTSNAKQFWGNVDYTEAIGGGWALVNAGANINVFMENIGGNFLSWTYTTPATLSDGNWHNLIVTYSSLAGSVATAVNFYFDGTLQTATGLPSMTPGTLWSTSIHFAAIGDTPQLETTQIGKYAYPAFYNFQLTSGDVSTIAAGANLSGALAQWLFTEGTGTTAADSSGNGNTLTLNTGFTWSTDVPFTPPTFSKKKASMFLVF